MTNLRDYIMLQSMRLTSDTRLRLFLLELIYPLESLTNYLYNESALFKKSLLCFECFVALRPKSTAMVIAGRSVTLTTLFPGQA